MRIAIKIFLAIFVLGFGWGIYKIQALPSRGIEGIWKFRSIFLKDIMESTPVEFRGHRLVVANQRPHRGGWEDAKINVYNFDGNKVASVPSPDEALISALVTGDKLYVFSTTSSSENSISIRWSDDLVNWSSPKTILLSKRGETIYNTSVTKVGDDFVMAYEVGGVGHVGFSVRFATSKDLQTWREIGDVFSQDRYAACPTIRYVNGIYYLLYLVVHEEKFVTVLARSSDLVHWKYAKNQILWPSKVWPSKGEGVNNSDVDVLESGGITYFVYAVGDQQDWVDLKMATYIGSIQRFFESLDYGDEKI